MTLKLAKRLQARQAGKISLAIFDELFEKRSVINQKLLRDIFRNTTNMRIREKIANYYTADKRKRDAKVIGFLNRSAVEKFNANPASRESSLRLLIYLAREGETRTIRGLSLGVRDSSKTHRRVALLGLREFSKRGNPSALPALAEGVKDKDEKNRELALDGLKDLYAHGNTKAMKLYEEYKQKEGRL